MVHFLTPWALTLKIILFMGMTSQLQAVIGSQLKMVNGEIPHLITQTANPCPAPEKIQPCVCSVKEASQMTMDCSDVTSEDELKSVFNQEFSFTNFKELTIGDNNYINTIRKGDLGNCSFEKIKIEFSSLTKIEEGALEKSYDTLQYLYLWVNRLIKFLDISHFTRLMEINLTENNFQQFPTLVSSTVVHVNLNYHQVEAIPVDALKGLPALITFEMTNGPLTSVPPGTFTFSEKLNTVLLSHNNLTTLPKNTVQLYGSRTALDLSFNNISHLPKEAFSGITGLVNMYKNRMEELDEETWIPLLENNVDLYIEENPFGCDCDIAWLILDQTLLDRVSDAPSCADGTLFTDLDPIYYEEMC